MYVTVNVNIIIHIKHETITKCIDTKKKITENFEKDHIK